MIKLIRLFFREKETEILKDQIDKLNSAITKEEEKAKELEVKARYIMLDKSLYSLANKVMYNEHYNKQACIVVVDKNNYRLSRIPCGIF